MKGDNDNSELTFTRIGLAAARVITNLKYLEGPTASRKDFGQTQLGVSEMRDGDSSRIDLQSFPDSESPSDGAFQNPRRHNDTAICLCLRGR